MLYTHRSQTLKFHISHVHVRYTAHTCTLHDSKLPYSVFNCNLFHNTLVLSVSAFPHLTTACESRVIRVRSHTFWAGSKIWLTRTKLHAETRHYWENLRKCPVYLWRSSLLCLWLCSNHTDTVCWQSTLYHIKVNVPNSRRRFMYCVVFTLYRLVNSYRRLERSQSVHRQCQTVTLHGIIIKVCNYLPTDTA